MQLHKTQLASQIDPRRRKRLVPVVVVPKFKTHRVSKLKNMQIYAIDLDDVGQPLVRALKVVNSTTYDKGMRYSTHTAGDTTSPHTTIKIPENFANLSNAGMET